MIPILYVGGIQLSKLQLLHCEISEKNLGVVRGISNLAFKCPWQLIAIRVYIDLMQLLS